jgi:hypothetical protein
MILPAVPWFNGRVRQWKSWLSAISPSSEHDASRTFYRHAPSLQAQESEIVRSRGETRKISARATRAISTGGALDEYLSFLPAYLLSLRLWEHISLICILPLAPVDLSINQESCQNREFADFHWVMTRGTRRRRRTPARDRRGKNSDWSECQ